ncbi:2-nitropropane dioxygenase [Deinococcus irradiatisoli]|uniref:Propionate 3-nitronate monooxygenase n=1 Tax=Deinococcus irradiatisoli TaxID=2202254 RepID=A0A2Z3JGK8_9DEIO|nr:nitronate monooxygenase [Deinococcus irradiatisoli]AWN22631.1 2-nitropropane dioxygenase [Deinococcus irradiatisoli]
MNSLMEQLGFNVPIMLAPLGGGPGSPALAAAISAAGGLGSVGSAYFTPEQIREAGAAVRAVTRQPFALNLFAPQPWPQVGAAALQAAQAELAGYHRELGLPAPQLPDVPELDFAAQFRAVLDVRPAALSFTFGVLGAAELTALKNAGILSIGTCGSLEEARELHSSGVDALCVQGREAGGHRGSWLHDARQSTLDLTRAVAAGLPSPVIAAGGLMDASDVRAALAAGAQLAACGTAFLLADEAGTSPPYRAALSSGGDTLFTQAFSGKWARGLANRLTREVRSPLPFPWQNALTRALRSSATQQGRSEYLSLWAGEGVNRITAGPAAQLLARLWPADPEPGASSPNG